MKLLEPALQVDASSQVRLDQEVKATASLTPPNTVRVFDFGSTDERRLFYSMELFERESLGELVRS